MQQIPFRIFDEETFLRAKKYAREIYKGELYECEEYMEEPGQFGTDAEYPFDFRCASCTSVFRELFLRIIIASWKSPRDNRYYFRVCELVCKACLRTDAGSSLHNHACCMCGHGYCRRHDNEGIGSVSRVEILMDVFDVPYHDVKHIWDWDWEGYRYNTHRERKWNRRKIAFEREMNQWKEYRMWKKSQNLFFGVRFLTRGKFVLP